MHWADRTRTRKCHFENLVAARARKVSGPKMFCNPIEFAQQFQWLFQNDVCEFESYMPSQGVSLSSSFESLGVRTSPYIGTSDHHPPSPGGRRFLECAGYCRQIDKLI